MSLVKKLILDTLDGEETKALKRTLMAKQHEEQADSSSQETDERMQDEQLQAEQLQIRKDISQSLLQENVEVISRNIHTFWSNHVMDIKRALSIKGTRSLKQQSRNASTRDAVNK
jgi:hypothetical protein